MSKVLYYLGLILLLSYFFYSGTMKLRNQAYQEEQLLFQLRHLRFMVADHFGFDMPVGFFYTHAKQVNIAMAVFEIGAAIGVLLGVRALCYLLIPYMLVYTVVFHHGYQYSESNLSRIDHEQRQAFFNFCIIIGLFMVATFKGRRISGD